MNKNKDTKEKICAFYASDYHFEMMSLPYINKKLESNDEVVILTENNLDETVKTLLTKTNFKEDRKKKILSLNWKNNDQEKLELIKNSIDASNKIVVFVKGNKDYIRIMNDSLDRFIPQNSSDVKVIDCYNVDEVGENLDVVMDMYQKVFKTTGEEDIVKQ